MTQKQRRRTHTKASATEKRYESRGQQQKKRPNETIAEKHITLTFRIAERALQPPHDVGTPSSRDDFERHRGGGHVANRTRVRPVVILVNPDALVLRQISG